MRHRREGVVLAYGGRRATTSPGSDLPQESVPGLAARVGRLLGTLLPTAVVGAAAAGVDLVLLEAARHRGIAAEVVLPTGRSEFRASSVADIGGPWPQLYDRVLDGSGVTVHEHRIIGTVADRFVTGNELILDRAAELGDRHRRAVVVLGVLGPTREGDDVTAALLAAAAHRRFVTLRLDPRTGAIVVDGRRHGILAESPPDNPTDLLTTLLEAIRSRTGDGHLSKGPSPGFRSRE